MSTVFRLGGHVSAAGGAVLAVERAAAIGANTMQIFGSSPRQWGFKVPDSLVGQVFRQALERADIAPVFLHAPYLINLASPVPATRKKSTELLAGTLAIAEVLGAKGAIFHIGSGAELPKEKARDLVVGECKRIFAQVPGKTALILENSAGGGQKLGGSLEEIGEMLDQIASPRALACFDTAHAFESGAVPDYAPESVASLVRIVGATIGWERLAAVHANDSKTAWNSRHDRHENIGDGHLGAESFRNLLARKEFRAVPWLLEVPGIEGEGPDRENIDRLKRLLPGLS